jgi:hypothetical protein
MAVLARELFDSKSENMTTAPIILIADRSKHVLKYLKAVAEGGALPFLALALRSVNKVQNEMKELL